MTTKLSPSSFQSPLPATNGGKKEQLERTLSGGNRKKQKRKLHHELLQAGTVKKPKPPHSKEETPTRQLFPVKKKTKSLVPRRLKVEFTRKELQPSSSSSSCSSSSSSSSEDEDEASSDECEVSFDAITFGNTRIIREAIDAQSPMSTTSSLCSSASILKQPVGLEYRFHIASTVSSIAVAPNGKFLIVGFYNGTIYLYPLNDQSMTYRHGVLLDHITARGMYTQLMVKVAIPDDGKFIFAGVYRGSTEIRAFEVDSITFPDPDGHETTLQNHPDKEEEEDDDDDGDDDDDDDVGVPAAHAITHTYSDAKLKGFGAVTSIPIDGQATNEYHLLCGLGIKSIHMWRFFQHPQSHEWSWECIFDKQTNGISVEFVAFDRHVPHQILSKSEHQHIRVWTLAEQVLEDDRSRVTMTKVRHQDVKQTIDALAVFGETAYGGNDALALIDLSSGGRQELPLPLSSKEQDTRVQSSRSLLSSMRRSRRGVNDAMNDQNQRHMRTVSQVAGHDRAPFTVGMCSDGSVFYLENAHRLEYVEGYESFFHDASNRKFQAQFSDLTRLQTSGSLAVLPSADEWLVAAANGRQLLVRSQEAFLKRHQQTREYKQVHRGMKHVVRELGAMASSEEDESSDEELTKPNERKEPTDPTEPKEPEPTKEKAQALLQTPIKQTKKNEQETPVNAAISPVVSVTSISSGSSNPNTPEPRVLNPNTPASPANNQRQDAPVLPPPSNDCTKARVKAREVANALLTLEIAPQETNQTIETNEIQEPAIEDKAAQDIDVVESPTSVEVVVVPAVDDDGDDADDEQEDEPENLEVPVPYATMPLHSDASLLLTASCFLYQNDPSASPTTVDHHPSAVVNHHLIDQSKRFAQQYERTERRFQAQKEQLLLTKQHQLQQRTCICHTRKPTKKASSSLIHWKKQLARDFQKKKQAKRKCRKQFTVQTTQLIAHHHDTVLNLLQMQKLEADALDARSTLDQWMQQLPFVQSSSTCTLSYPFPVE